jgi:ABC-2 type transport system ATP-binding protein
MTASLMGVTVEGISKRFGSRTRALDDVSFEARPGEVFALLGANGAGKSTLVRILATLLRPSAGSARVAGLDVTTRPAEARRAIGVALQEVGLDPAQRVRGIVGLHARLHGYTRRQGRERTRELLLLVGLEDVADRRVGTLSGGMRRRLDLALALVHRPRVLLLDEPTTGLDPGSRRELWREIARLRESEVTILLTTQHLDEAEQLADRVAILAAGSVIADGTPAALKRRHSRMVLNATFPDRRQLAAAAALLDVELPGGGLGLRAPLADDPSAIADVLARFKSHGLALSSLALSQPTLEDVFLATIDAGDDGDDG